jgi:hypothetical protein
LIDYQRGQICFGRNASAMRHRRSVEPYRSPLVAFVPLWLSHNVRDVFLNHADLKKPINSTAIMKATDVLMSLSLPAPSSPPHPSAYIRLTMLRMRLSVLRVLRGQSGIANDQQVLGVPLLGGLREVKTSCDNALPINNA